MRIVAKIVASLALAVLQTACTDGSTTRSVAGGSQAIRLERYCTPPGLSPSFRHTYVLIDEHVLSRADTAEDFGRLNARLRNVVIGFVTPDAAALTGLMDHRERLSILLLPRNGTAAKLLFTGCLPSLAAEELAAADREGSALASFFTGGVRQQIAEEARLFRSRVVNALILAGRAAPGPAEPESGALGRSQLIQSLLASGRLVNGENGVPRVLLLADLAEIDLGGAATPEAARRNGFTDGQSLALDFGRAELHVFLVNAEHAALARDYTRAFFLARHADLMTWADDAPPPMPAPPIMVERYNGEAQYPHGPEPIQIRIAADRNGALVNSWMILRGVENRSIPMTGRRFCNADGLCTLRSDDGGFAQAWSPSAHGAPVFDRLLPFVGMREWEITTQSSQLSGRVFDPTVRMGGGNMNSFSLRGAIAQAPDGVNANQVAEATF